MFEDKIKEAKMFSLNMFEEDGKLMLKDDCEICSSEFIKEVIIHENGYTIPRYCETCVKENGILNENYA